MGEEFIDFKMITHLMGAATYGTWKSRVDEFPEVVGQVPSFSLAREITTPGPGQLRALLVHNGNPARSSVATQNLEKALQQLDLLVVLDVQFSDTARFADYVLPCALGPERDRIPWLTAVNSTKPVALWTDKAVDPPEGCHEEWWIIDQICERLGIVPFPSPIAWKLGEHGYRVTPQEVFDFFLRMGPHGDWFGRRPEGWTREKAWNTPHGELMADNVPTGSLERFMYTEDKRIELNLPVMAEELERYRTRPADDEFPYRLMSMRELRTCNTYLLYVPSLARGLRGQRLRMNPKDAANAGIREGDIVTVRSRHGKVQAEVTLTEEMAPGNAALPHGWGHAENWEAAHKMGGANYNNLTSDDPRDHDQLSGNANLQGIDVAIELAEPAA